ncbi:MAG: hypothetical protein JXP37_08355 [Coriobacteriia bacterium]|nr:hypothetical protein [Coriobacteriia bacterium]
MGRLYDYAQRVEEHIKRNNLDVFKTRGAIALQAGFIVSIVRPDDPDDPTKIEALRAAAQDVLGIRLD